ncbi:TetR/AcrR family transcriptional regulator [Novosphingobium mangrovi (ex Huang et al. 2023)]|uniref:TetR/AcrR family transcriptional regulator n=1 Tax=Novosphingobium mangrovi (ex Huang et al. 2023) TaxID=2976432 RepID=A0ABT2I537_9SPHN|nr:TetR/AcrR family transcriptional regulator [Novosphingobium mangrovi (ex Huang et al. 2023)]MCT2399931.1 TetR/AcrR family transcriptional regulator [Novosphingobium mangrovi (ex Huang et al. 2023)]
MTGTGQAVRRKVRASAPSSRSRGRPTSEDSAEIENQLLAAALGEFIREGYGGASMRSIAKAANVARTTLQARYETKEALFQAIMTQQIARMAAATSLGSQDAPDLGAGLKAYANRALSYSLEGDYLEVNRLVYGAANQFPEVARAAIESTRVGIEQITDFIRHCAQADGIACRRPEVPAECFILLLRGWYGFAILRDEQVTQAEREAWVDGMVGTLIAGRAHW